MFKPPGNRSAGGGPPFWFVKVQRLARPPMPWAWAIYKDGATDPFQRSVRLYRSADEAWAAGHAVLDRIRRAARAAQEAPLDPLE